MSGGMSPGDEARGLAEAAAWRVALSEAGVESNLAFERWLEADPQHRVAWRQVNTPWDLLGGHAAAPEVMAVRRDALHRAQRSIPKVRRIMPRWAVAVVWLVVAGAAGWAWNMHRPEVLRTALGERRVIPLEDGSRVSLDSGSEVRVRYGRDARRLELRRGQARFDVVPDVHRPFTVATRDQLVVATGTAFNVDLLGKRVLVTLIEGRVEVGPRGRDDAGATSGSPDTDAVPITALKPGQQLVIEPEMASIPVPRSIDLDRATAWESGQLVFSDETLESVAQRVARYHDRPLQVDAGAGRLRISGVFRAGDLDTFIEVVTHYLPVVAVPRQDGGIVLRHR